MARQNRKSQQPPPTSREARSKRREDVREKQQMLQQTQGSSRQHTPSDVGRRTKRKHEDPPRANVSPSTSERRSKHKHDPQPRPPAITAPPPATTRPTYLTSVLDLRCSPSRLDSVCRCLTPAQREDVVEMGFGTLLNLPTCKLNRPLLLALVNSYDLIGNQIVTPLGTFNVTVASFGSVLGLPYTGKLLSGIQVPNAHSGDMECFRDKTPSQLREMVLNNPPGPTFRRAFLLFAMMTFLLPSMTPKVSPKFLPFVADVDHLEDYNWSRQIFEYLYEGMRRYRISKATSLNGCVFVLQILYFHFQMFGSFDTRADPLPPWLNYWTEQRLEEAIANELRSPLGIVRGEARPQRLPRLSSSRPAQRSVPNTAEEVANTDEDTESASLYVLDSDSGTSQGDAAKNTTTDAATVTQLDDGANNASRDSEGRPHPDIHVGAHDVGADDVGAPDGNSPPK